MMICLNVIIISIGIKFLAGAGFVFSLHYARCLLDTYRLPVKWLPGVLLSVVKLAKLDTDYLHLP